MCAAAPLLRRWALAALLPAGALLSLSHSGAPPTSPIASFPSPYPDRPRRASQGPGVWGQPGGESFDCAMRKLAYTFGKQLRADQGSFDSLHEALDLNGFKGTCKTEAAPLTEEQLAGAKNFAEHTDMTVPEGAIFVSPHGDDGAEGTIVSPLQSIQLACDRAAATIANTVVLREGTHYLPETIFLGAEHSGLTMQAHPGEKAVVSGGKELKVTWKKSTTAGTGDNIYVADISGQVTDVPGLQIDGKRATRARYPNLPGGLEASCGYGCMVPSNAADWTPPDFNKFGPVTYYTDNQTRTDRERRSSLRAGILNPCPQSVSSRKLCCAGPDTPSNWFQHYSVGINGLCSVYTPPVSYWCSEHTAGGGAFAFRTPIGMTPKAGALPHTPYKDVSEAQVFVWRPARWANWMFEVGDYDKTTNNISFGYGGFQGARGSNNGGDWFVENIMEELDNPGEFFFDKKTSQLYLYHNGTGAPPASATVVVPQKQVLVNVSGTQFKPVTDVSLVGITYSGAAYTYMEPHGVPSAGDWALDRYGAIFLQGTEGAMISGCSIERVDGNGVMVSGYNRNATMKHNEISYVGGNAFAAWGYTNETATDPGRPGVEITNHPMAGVDGTDGEHPRYTTVINNIAREVGLYEKQSSFFVEAKTAQSIILGNVFFNGPRAGINANDGFGGGDEIGHNLVFSSCRESGDHGAPFQPTPQPPHPHRPRHRGS